MGWWLSSVLGIAALAAPPSGADPDSEMGRWYKSLERPTMPGISCCSVADCRPVPSKWDEVYWVFKDGKWIVVPSKIILLKHDNPVGEAILCSRDGTLYCFLPAAGT